MQARGASGPSGLDAPNVRRMAYLTNFKQVSEKFCNTVSEVARKICCENVNLVAFETYTACRTIGLDKGGLSAVRPIGTEEVLRRVIGKTFSKLLKANVFEEVGVRQTWGGQEGGIEAAIHQAAKNL